MNLIRTERYLRIYFRQELRRMMASLSQRGDHATITATQTRQKVIANATVTTMRQISPSVKWLCLKVQDNSGFSFKPGQWVDFFLPNSDTLSGYSICSGPKQLKAEGTIELAVKISDHAVAVWVHERCEEGVEVRIESGGDFFYDPNMDAGELERDILLLAGGVGINPLVSIFQHLTDLQSDHDGKRSGLPVGNVCLLYSARSDEELLFKRRILDICSRFENVTVRFFVTKETQSADGVTQLSGRIDSAVIDEAMSTFRSKSRLSFVCGPPQMLSDMESLLQAAGFRSHEIRYEKWW